MRVYEVAKLFNISNKELLELLASHGFAVKSHMSIVADDAFKLLEKELKENAPELEKKAPEMNEKSFAQPKQEITIKEPVKKVKEKEGEPPKSQEFLVQPMTIGQIAEKIDKPSSELILALLRRGIVCAKNQLLDKKTVEDLVSSYGLPIIHPEKGKKEEKVVAVIEEGAVERLPVVVVLGHVDHGKTTLLDFVRKTRVAQKEKGGITQHLGAYEAETPHGNIVFLDTPGHEAFSNIRGRGVSVADLAILVVAADDSVKPQTIEAINKIKAACIPAIVAINKMDKAEPARVEAVKGDLARYEMLPEEWGGDTVCVPISAKFGDGVDKLLEMVALQAQLMDLKANIDRPAVGFVLESRLQKGRGPVATVICQNGTLHVGDYFSAGYAFGKVSSLMDSYGRHVSKLGPSVPVLVAGFSELPAAGDHFEVITQEKYRKLKSSKDARSAMAKRSIDESALKIIIKTDTSSTKEALLDAIDKLISKTKKNIYIIYSGIGDIAESDVVLATNTGAMIIGLHTKADSKALDAAQENMVRIMRFDIIYKLLEYLEELIKEEEPIKLVSKKIGEAVIRKVFHIKNIGTIAGSYLKKGRFTRDGHIVAWRGKEKIGEGAIKSLERDRKPVKEVHAGFEFAFLVEGIDWEVDDRAECFIQVPE
jgi:translation initiation factor IF-2